ncbi:MAG: HU family DNA-binding protein [Nanoarchaeota archaeon]|nr:HU family DNA-binding protein [Nanoarchaeota archaeon]
MNKKNLVEAIAKETELSKAKSECALNAVMKHIIKGAKKESVQLVGFGTFKTVKMKARKGVNPQTGAAIKIPAKKVIKWKVSKNLKW